MAAARWLAGVWLASVIGCGDPLVDGRYEGEPLFTLSGQVEALLAPKTTAPTRIGVLWVNFARNGDIALFQEAQAESGAPPFGFRLQLFAPPTQESLNVFGENAVVGMGFISAFEDVNNDGLYDEDEGRNFQRGAAVNHVMLYFERINLEDESLQNILVNPEAATPGHHLARGVCGTQNSLYDRLEIIPNESVAVSSGNDDADEELDPRSCLNFF